MSALSTVTWTQGKRKGSFCLLDLSATGCYVEGEELPSPHERLHLHLRNGGIVVAGTAMVRRVELLDGRVGYGLEFESLRPNARADLESLVESMDSDRSFDAPERGSQRQPEVVAWTALITGLLVVVVAAALLL